MKYTVISLLFSGVLISSCSNKGSFSGEWVSTPVNSQELYIDREDASLVWGFKTQIMNDTFNLKMENIREAGDTLQFSLKGFTRGPLTDLSLSVQLIRSGSRQLRMYSKPIMGAKESDFIFDENDYTSFIRN